MRKHLYFLQQISPGLARKLWKDLSAKWKNSMQTWAVSAMVKRPVIQSGFPEKHPEEIRWYPVAHAEELEDVDYNFDNNLIVPDGAC